MYIETTNGFEIRVEPRYLLDESKPDLGYFVFSYTVTIRNVGESKAQLLSRHWIITDGNGRTHEVKGPGVIGQQPEILPGGEYQYTSFCPIGTPTGNMRGTYRMKPEHGESFDITIPLFFLRTNLSATQEHQPTLH